MRVVGGLGCVRLGDLQELAPQRVDQVEPDNGDAAFFKVANIGDCVHAGRKIDEIVREASVGNVFQQVQLLKRTS